MRTHKRIVRHVAPPRIVDVGPDDPLQTLDDTDNLIQVDIDARPAAEAIEDLDAAIAAASPQPDEPDDDTYGVDVPHAGEPDLSAPEHEEGFRDSTLGEHVFEMLDAYATELGPEPGVPIEIDDDITHRYQRETRDRPIADEGAGGPAGR
jgi:hypothetical protein